GVAVRDAHGPRRRHHRHGDVSGSDGAHLGASRTGRRRRGPRRLRQISAHAEPEPADSWRRFVLAEKARRLQNDDNADRRSGGVEGEEVRARAGRDRRDRLSVRRAETVLEGGVMSSMNRREFGAMALSAFSLPKALPREREPFRRAEPRRAEPARAYRYIHLDVFTDKRLQGNQLLVYVDPAGLDTDAMQTLTRESNFSENTFVFRPEAAGTDYRVRIFSRTAEMPFAGHPTIGTAFALAHVGRLKPGQAKTVFGLGVGPTNIDLEWKDGTLAFAWMAQQKPTFGKTIADSAALAAALGLDAASIDARAPAQEVYSGSTFVIVPLATRKAV